jgi:3-hydroxyacyl-CoA dehydrogenase
LSQNSIFFTESKTKLIRSSCTKVPVMSLVELIAALQTSQDTLTRAREFAVRCGKVVTVSKDTPGFISNRVSFLIHNS